MTKLFQNLALIQSQLRSIPETGFNSFHKYSYATAEDIIGAVRPICSQHGVFISITCTSHQILKDGKAASVVVTLTATDAETGESTTCSMAGYAEDAKSDKSLWKAVTGASKYCIRSFFCLATCDDPELEETSERPPSVVTSTPVATSNNGNGKRPAQPVTNINIPTPIPRPPLTQGEGPPPAPAGKGDGAAALLEATTSEMTRLGWDTHQGREYLDQVFGQRSRKHLTPAQLRDFLEHLRSLPTASREPTLVAS